jgi:NADPH:quinone reductase-like Zn-dependent oxidoreductase
MAEVAAPVVRPRQVLVKVLASTINIDDIHVAEGTFYGGIPIGKRPRRDRPVTPGSDLAGVVVAAGRDVRSVRIGEPVFGVQMAFHAKGTWAEFCAVDQQWITKKPDALSFGTAAACGVSGLVALSAMYALKLHAKQRIVVVGASGGIGAMAVQLAHRAGAEVIGVCGSANVERAYRLGCSRVIDYKLGPWDRALLAEGDARIDRVLDVVGGRDTEQMGERVLGKDGVFVTVVGPERFIGDQPLGWSRILPLLLHIGGRIVSSRFRGPRYVLAGPGPGGGKALSDVASAAAAGVLPPIDCTVPFELEPMRQAIRRAAAHQNNGRILIQMEDVK